VTLTIDTGNMFESGAEALVNTVNCVGHMGGGLAKVFADKFPLMNEDYENYCEAGILRPGFLHTYYSNIGFNSWIINFPTKDDWRDPSEYEYIIAGLQALIPFVRKMRIQSVAIPALGCGLGGLDWKVVQAYIKLHTAKLPDVNWILYPPK